MKPLPIHLSGSLQNPAWDPTGTQLVLTRFRRGYNKRPADIFVYNLASRGTNALLYDGNENVSEPGSTWNKATNEIIYSSDGTPNGKDQAFVMKMDQHKTVTRVTDRSGMVWEPSLAPDGGAFVYEYHVTEDRGQIVIHDRAAKRYREITASNHDCRQPCWSPRGDYIVYQRREGEGDDEKWFLFLYGVENKKTVQFTHHGDETDATFSPDGGEVIYSTGGNLVIGRVDGAALNAGLVIGGAHYLGAPSISPDGKTVACEYSAEDDPDGGPGTGIALIELAA